MKLHFSSSMKQQAPYILEEAFLRQRTADRALGELISSLSRLGARAAIFGGWPRDSLLSVTGDGYPSANDIDIVVTDISRETLASLLPDDTSVNAFGGFASSLYRMKLDIWCIEDTYTLAKRGLPYEIDLLPSTTVFTHESIVFKPSVFWGKPEIVEDSWYKTFDNGETDMQRGLVRFPAFQVGRLLQHIIKLRLGVTDQVMQFISKALSSKSGFEEVDEGIRELGAPAWKEQALCLTQKLRKDGVLALRGNNE